MMKTLTITLILVTSMLIAQSSSFGFKLIVTSKENSFIRVSIDQGPLSPPSAKVRLADLTPGKHWIKIVRRSNYPGMQHNQLIYKGRIHIQPNTVTHAVVNKFGNFTIRNVKPLFNANQIGYGNTSSFCGMNGCGLPFGHMGSCQTAHQPCGFNGYGFAQGHSGMHSVNNGTCGNYYSQSYNNYGQSGWSNQSYGFGPQQMSLGEFNSFIQTLRNQSFDSTRLKIAKQVISQNYLSTKQVSELMRLFSFESNRLDIAKFAYTHTVDKQNYYQLSNSFDFNSSINQLMNFISNG